MDPFHERLAQIGLTALAEFGFALAGGYAVQAYGLLQRPSEDVDMFTTLAAEHSFPEAVRGAVAAYEGAGLTVDVLLENATFGGSPSTTRRPTNRPRSNSASTGASIRRPCWTSDPSCP